MTSRRTLLQAALAAPLLIAAFAHSSGESMNSFDCLSFSRISLCHSLRRSNQNCRVSRGSFFGQIQ